MLCFTFSCYTAKINQFISTNLVNYFDKLFCWLNQMTPDEVIHAPWRVLAIIIAPSCVYISCFCWHSSYLVTYVVIMFMLWSFLLSNVMLSQAFQAFHIILQLSNFMSACYNIGSIFPFIFYYIILCMLACCNYDIVVCHRARKGNWLSQVFGKLALFRWVY